MRNRLPAFTLLLSLAVCFSLEALSLAADSQPPSLLLPAATPTPKPAPVVPLVPFEKLIPFLPLPPEGWTSEAPQGSTTDTAELKISTAQRSYNKGDDQNAMTTSITIIDFAGNQAYFEATTAAWQLNVQTPEGYDKGVEIDGLRGFEHYTKTDNASSLAVVVSKRYFIQIELTHQDPKELREWLKKIDAKKLAEMK